MAPSGDPDLVAHVVPRLVHVGVKLESRNEQRNTPLLEAIERFGAFCVKVSVTRFSIIAHTWRDARLNYRPGRRNTHLKYRSKPVSDGRSYAT